MTGNEVVAGRFRLTHRLARGGSGEVFAAIDESTGGRIALKRLLASAGARSGAVHFMREYYALSELRHPRIIEVHDYGVDRGVPYYTMELLDGHDLSELSPLPYREACAYLRDVASSLALLHARRLLHRDVSPRNVRRTSDGRCKLLDFGAMIPFGTAPNLTGTPPCIAPEAVQRAGLDQASDLYSLGATAYHVLTGRHAYPAADLSALPFAWAQGIVAPRRLVPEIPAALEDLVLSLLSMDPLRRPQSAAEVIDRLSAIGGLPADDNMAVGRSFLASSQLIGRNAECAQVQACVAGTLQGRGATVLFTGEPGTGKTRILSAAALIAQTSGLAVVRTTLRKQRGVSSSFVQDVLAGVQQAAPVESAAASRHWPLVSAAMSGMVADSERAELLRQVDEFVREVVRARPLLITIDDVHHADDIASGLIVSLAYATSDCGLALMASHAGHELSSMLAALSGLATTMEVRALDRMQTALLSASLFGDVANLDRVSDRFFEIGRGNPKLTLALAEQLLARGTLRYVDGSWVLPAELSEPLPKDIADALMLRLQPLGEAARALAELLSVRRGGARAEQLLALSAPQAPDRVFRALEELVTAGILESAGDEYAYVQDALRSELTESLSEDRSQQLHGLWADHLLGQGELDRSARLEAGWHLVHTKDELRGADLLAKVAPELVEHRLDMTAALPALEHALEVYERHGKSLAVCLRLRALLVLSSYLVDFRLAERYADQTIDALYEFTGLPDAERCARWFGKRLGFLAGIAWAALRWCVRPARTRGPHVIAALRYYAQSTMGLLSQRALAMDVDGVGAALARMRGFQHSALPGLSLVHMVAQAVYLHAQGRGADVHRSIDRAVARLDRGRPWPLSQHEHNDLLVGVLLLRGINESYREHSRSLDCAGKLDRIGTPLAQAASLRVSMTYYLLRGDVARAQHYRRLLDLKAIQAGGHWQVEWIALPLEWLAGTFWADLMAIRRAIERIDRLTDEAASFAIVREARRLPYCFRRGEFAEAAVIGEAYMKRHAPLTRAAWAVSYAVTALAYIELGRAQRAREICEDALAHVTEDDREYFVFYLPLETAYAAALALTGDEGRSRELFRERIARLRASGEQACAIVMHEYRVKVARLLGDRERLREALDDLHEAAILSRNPGVVAWASRLAEERAGTAPAAQRAPDYLDEPDPHTMDRTVSASQALAVLGEYADCSEAYLYSQDHQSLQLSASLEDKAPPCELMTQLQKLAAANDTAPVTRFDSGYCAYRLRGGFAVLRCSSGELPRVPETLLAEISRSLPRRAS